jgi:hypothetical protein
LSTEPMISIVMVGALDELFYMVTIIGWARK